MDDFDRILAESMRGAADRAPAADELLGTVHRRSRRRHRRRITAGLATVAAVLALGVPFGAVQLARSGRDTAPATSVPASPGPSPSDPAPSRGPSPSGRPAPPSKAASSTKPAPDRSATGERTTAVRLTSGWTAPTFPWTLPPTDGMRAPVASMDSGAVSAFFEATELREHADTTVTVSAAEPVFSTGADEQTRTVRGHAATLRTVDVEPAAQLTLIWRESPGRWIQLATDDTYTPQEVVALAESLTAASIAVSPPFALGLSPQDLAPRTVSRSRMTFGAPGAGEFAVVLRKRQPLTGADEQVGGYAAALTRDAGGARLAVDVTDWDATLEVTVGAGLTMSDAELLRFAAGVRILDRSDPE